MKTNFDRQTVNLHDVDESQNICTSKIITALVRAKRSSKIHIYINEEYTLSVVEDIVTKEGLYKGKKINDVDLTRIKTNSLNKELYFKSIEYISRRPRSTKEIKDYLSRKNFNLGLEKSKIDDIIVTLKERKYLNDRDFANWWIQNRIDNSKKSQFEIEIELRKKGINLFLIKEVLAVKYNANTELNNINKLITKQLKKHTYLKLDTNKRILKLQKYLMNKGFKWNLVKEATLNIK